MKAPRWYRAESERYLHLDALRFFSAAAITVFHYRGLVWPPPYDKYWDLFSPLHLGVDLFFTISGIMMADLYAGKLGSIGQYLGFMRKRVARIAPLHYLTFGFFLLASAVAVRIGLPIDNVSHYDPGCIVPNLTLTHAFGYCHNNTFNTPSWSISCEMAMYVALPVLLWLTRYRRLAFFCVLAMLVGLTVWDFNWTSRTFNLGVLRAAPSFSIGLLLAGSRPWLGRIPSPGKLMLAGAVLFAVLTGLPVSDVVRLVVIYAIVALALAADQQRAVGDLVHGFAPLGRITYSVYMLNEPLWIVMGSVLGKHILHLAGLRYAIWLAVLTLVALPLSALASLVFFETPMRRWISGRTKPRAIAEAPADTPADAGAEAAPAAAS